LFSHEVLVTAGDTGNGTEEEVAYCFTKKVGQELRPNFLSVVDDPTV